MRSLSDVNKIKAQAQAEQTSGSGSSDLPPAYIFGLEVSVNKDAVCLTPGVASVRGCVVALTSGKVLSSSYWVSKRVSSQSYYVYLSKDGKITVDRYSPIQSSQYYYFAHPVTGARYLGGLQTDDKNKLLRVIAREPVYIGGTTVFESGYDPSSKVASVGGKYASSNGEKSKLEIFPDDETALLVKRYDTLSSSYKNVFRILIDGDNEGDVIIGRYDEGFNGAEWDESAATLKIRGKMYQEDGTPYPTTEDIDVHGELSNEHQNVSTDTNGDGGNFTFCQTTLTIMRGGVDDSANWTFDAVPSNGLTGEKSNQNRTYQVTGMTTDDGYVDITASCDGCVSITKRFSISKSKTGVPGDPLTSYDLSIDAPVVAKSVDGVYTPASLTISARSATGSDVPIPYAGRFVISETTDGSVWVEKYISQSDESSKVWTPSAGIKAIHVYLYLAGGTTDLRDDETIPIVSDGLPGADGIDGSDGMDARSVTLTASIMAFSYNTAGASPSPSSSTITATALNTSGTVYYQFFKNDVKVQEGTGNTYSYIPQSAYSKMPDKIEVQIREGSLANPILARDQIIMSGLMAGAHGLTKVVSNESHVVPSDASGVVSDYNGSGTTIQIYEGSAALQYDTVLASGKFVIGTPVVSPAGKITVGNISGVGAFIATVAAHSGMDSTLDLVTITYPITARRADGTDITLSVVQTITKSKQGIQGSKGDPGTPGANAIVMTSATTPSGTYVGQIGVWNGQFYRWSGTAWEIYDAVLPTTNPIFYFSMDEVPAIPDNTASGAYISKFTDGSADGWAVNAGLASCNSIAGELVCTGNGAYSLMSVYRPNIGVNGNIVIVKIKSDDSITAVSYDNGNGVTNMVKAYDREGYAYYYAKAVAAVSYLALYIYYPSSAIQATKTLYLSKVYVGDSSYSTVLVNNAGNAHHASLLSGISIKGPSKYGIQIHGYYDSILIPGVKDLSNTSFTLCMRFARYSGAPTDGFQNVFGRGSYGGSAAFGIDSNGALLFQYRDSNNSAQYLSFGVVNSTWVTVGIVVNRTTQKIAAYQDGIKLGEQSIAGFTGTLNVGNFSTAPYILGGNGPAGVCNRAYDDLILYDSALSDSEMRGIYLANELPKLYTMADYRADALDDDGKLTPPDKQELLSKWKSIYNAISVSSALTTSSTTQDGEYSAIVASAVALSVSTTAYLAAVNALRDYLWGTSGVLLSMTTISTVTPGTLDGYLAAYRTAHQALVAAISAKQASNAQAGALAALPTCRGLYPYGSAPASLIDGDLIVWYSTTTANCGIYKYASSTATWTKQTTPTADQISKCFYFITAAIATASRPDSAGNTLTVAYGASADYVAGSVSFDVLLVNSLFCGSVNIAVTAGDNIVKKPYYTGTIGNASTSYKKARAYIDDDQITSWPVQAQLFASGTVRITFSLASSNSGATAYGRIYKKAHGSLSWTAVGTERSTTTSGTYTEDLSVSSGDLFTLYTKISSASYVAIGYGLQLSIAQIPGILPGLGE